MSPAILASELVEALAAGFGIAAGAVVLGIGIFRWYRMRQEFILTKLALEKGITQFPPTQPQWLVSLRQGLLIVALGAGLIVLGWIGWRLALKVERPPPKAAVVLATLPAEAPTTAPALAVAPAPVAAFTRR